MRVALIALGCFLALPASADPLVDQATAGLKLVDEDEDAGLAKIVAAERAATAQHASVEVQAKLLQIHGRALLAAEDNDEALVKLRASLALRDDAETQAAYKKATTAHLHDVLSFSIDASVGYTGNVLNGTTVETIGGYNTRGPSQQPSRSSDVTSESGVPINGDLSIEGRLVGHKKLELWLGYDFSQLAYVASSQDGYALQDHDVALRLLLTPKSWLSVKLKLMEAVSFTGLRTFAAYQNTVTGSVELGFKEGHGFRTKVLVKDAYGYTFDRSASYLDVNAFTFKPSEEYRWKWLRATLAYQLRVSTSGVLDHDIYYSNDLRCASSCDVGHLLSPLGYVGNLASLDLIFTAPWKMDFDFEVDYEHRDYAGTEEGFVLSTKRPFVDEQRVDNRVTLEAEITQTIPKGFSIVADVSYLRNISNIDIVVPQTGNVLDNRNFHTLTALLKVGYDL